MRSKPGIHAGWAEHMLIGANNGFSNLWNAKQKQWAWPNFTPQIWIAIPRNTSIFTRIRSTHLSKTYLARNWKSHRQRSRGNRDLFARHACVMPSDLKADWSQVCHGSTTRRPTWYRGLRVKQRPLLLFMRVATLIQHGGNFGRHGMVEKRCSVLSYPQVTVDSSLVPFI